MKPVIHAWLIVVGVAIEAHAQEAPDPSPAPASEQPAARITVPPVAVPAARSSPTADPRRRVVPVFELSGKSDGEGTLRIGLDLLVPFANRSSAASRASKPDHVNELRVKLALEAASHDGVTTLLEGSASGFDTESSVAGALDLTYTTLQNAPGLDARTVDSTSIAERRALLRDCMKNPGYRPMVFGRAADLENDADVDEIDAGTFCADARQRLARAEDDKTLPLPRRQLTFSFSAGRSAFRQLSPTSEPMVFEPTSARKPRFAAAMGYAQYAPAERLSLELSTSLASSYEVSGARARWCGPVGSVGRPGSAMAPAESCFELPLGDPARTTTLSAAAYLGFVGDDYNWRAAMGPVARFGFGGAETSYELGFDLPFYLVRSSAGFSGIVRVAPAALITRDATGVEDTRVLLTLTLLGNRTLFDTAFR